MIFWLIAGGMTALVVALMLAPLFRRAAAQPTREAYDLAVFRDQLAEIDRDLDRGVLNEGQAGAARHEVERRLLAVADRETPAADRASAAGSKGAGRMAAAALALFIPVAALGLYMTLGAPGAPSMPFAERPDAQPAPSGDMAELAEGLARRLQDSPDDPDGWRLLGRTYAEVGRYQDSAAALRQAIERGLDDADTQSFLGEVLVLGNNGEIVQEARTAFAKALEQEPGHPRALYYAALSLAQDGRLNDALDLWTKLAEAAPPDAPWRDVVLQQVRQAATELGVEPPAIAMAEAVAPEAAPAPRGPSAEDIEAASEMGAEERMAFIRTMVDGLAARLDEQPDDLDGWLRLTRAYLVLGELDEADGAFQQAARLADDLPAQAPERGTLEQLRGALEAAK